MKNALVFKQKSKQSKNVAMLKINGHLYEFVLVALKVNNYHGFSLYRDGVFIKSEGADNSNAQHWIQKCNDMILELN